LNGAGNLAFRQGNYTVARVLHEESLALWRVLDDRRGISRALSDLALVAKGQGEISFAQSLFEESRGISQELGNPMGIALALNNLGRLAERQGDYAEAQTLYEECLEIRRQLGNQLRVAASLANLGNVTELQGKYSAARRLHQSSLTIFAEHGHRLYMAESFEGLAVVAGALGQPERSMRLAGVAARLRDETGSALADEQDVLVQRLQPARRALSESDCARLWAEGQSWPLELAVSYALEHDQSEESASLQDSGCVARDPATTTLQRALSTDHRTSDFRNSH
jgi:tetratricopeptide (TPR) repeat protein